MLKSKKNYVKISRPRLREVDRILLAVLASWERRLRKEELSDQKYVLEFFKFPLALSKVYDSV